MSDELQNKELFKELAKRAIGLREEARKQGTPEDAKLGMQGTAAWAYAYRVLFNEIKPQLIETGIWVYCPTYPGSCFVDDVIKYTASIEHELDRLEGYRGYYTHL